MGSIKCTKNNTLVSQFDYINSLPNVSFVKDINSAFQSLSVGCLRITGWKSLEQAIFNTAYDFPSDASILADRLRDVDKKSMTKNGKILSLELINTDMGLASLLVERTPIMGQKGDVVGVHAQAIDIANTSFFQYSQMLSKVDQKIISSNKRSAVYILNSEHSPLPLNIQEQECLFFLMRGKTIGQIAEILNLTTYVVELYVESIKHSLGCIHKSQIIEKAIDSGFLYYIPEKLFKQNIGVIHENS